MQYVVTYVYCGDEKSEFFDDKSQALSFISDNVNEEAHETFALYEKVPLSFKAYENYA